MELKETFWREKRENFKERGVCIGEKKKKNTFTLSSPPPRYTGE